MKDKFGTKLMGNQRIYYEKLKDSLKIFNRYSIDILSIAKIFIDSKDIP